MITPIIKDKKKKEKQHEKKPYFSNVADYIYSRAAAHVDLIEKACKAKRRAVLLGLLAFALSVAVEIVGRIYCAGADMSPFGLSQDFLDWASCVSLPLLLFCLVLVYGMGHDFKKVNVRGWVNGIDYIDKPEELQRIVERHEEETGEHIALQFVTDLDFEPRTWESNIGCDIVEATALIFCILPLGAVFVADCYGIILQVLT